MKSTPLFVMSCALLAAIPGFAQVTVMPVPWDPTNFTSPHTVITGVQATLAATVSLGGSTDSFSYSWNFGDGSPGTSPLPVTTSGTGATVGNVYNLSVTYTYTAAAGTSYTAVLTVTDKTTSAVYTGNYYVIVQANTLTARVNTAIDAGLWYLHTSMDRATTTNGVIIGSNPLSNPVAIGGWDGQLGNGCLSSYDCLDSAGLNAYQCSGFRSQRTLRKRQRAGPVYRRCGARPGAFDDVHAAGGEQPDLLLLSLWRPRWTENNSLQSGSDGDSLQRRKPAQQLWIPYRFRSG